MSIGDEMYANKHKTTRGTTNTARSLEALARTSDTRGKLNWDEALPANLAACIVAAVAVGGAVSFSRSRDAGALSLTIFLDGNKKTLWYNQDAALDDELEVVITFLKSLGDK